jgi:enediyne biosynthesis protein E4
MPIGSHLLRRSVGIAILAVAVLGTGVPWASAAAITVRLRAVGSTSVAQGYPLQFKASVTNSSGSSVTVNVVFQLIPPARASSAIDFQGWSVSVPPSSSVSTQAEVTPGQWFASLGTYGVQAFVKGVPATGQLAFDVTAPTLPVPIFQDVTDVSGLHTTVGNSRCGQYAAGAAWADVDGNGYPDLYVPNMEEPAQLWIDDGNGHFTDEAVARGVDNGGASGVGAVFADYDNDDYPDLYVVNDGSLPGRGPNRLYHNDGTGHFTDVATAAGVSDGHAAVSASWGDYDNDGFLDLYVTSNSPCAPPFMYEPDRLYHNEGDGTFTDQTALLPESATMGAGYQAAWFDYNGDGRQDLYLANDDWGPSPDENHLWRNDGPGPGGTWLFTDVSVSSGTDYDINSMGIGIGDFNRDLKLDMAISNIGANVLAMNNGDGTFTDVAAFARVARPTQSFGNESSTWGLTFVDLNLDGWEDLFVAGGWFDDRPGQPSEVFTNDGVDGKFLDLSALSGADEQGSYRGVALADYDRDGLMDIYVVRMSGSPILFRNVTSAPGYHWLEVDLTGTLSNRDGCGTRLILTAGGGRMMRELFCGSTGLSSGSETVVHFGLGSATQAAKIVIEWPSGIRQVLRNVGADELIKVVESA